MYWNGAEMQGGMPQEQVKDRERGSRQSNRIDDWP